MKPATVRRWETRLTDAGLAGLLAERKGPKRKSKLTGDTVAAIRRLREDGASYRAIAAAAGVSEGSVRNALTDTDTEEPCAPIGADAHRRTEPEIEVEREVEIEVRTEEDCPATISAAPVTDTRAGAADAVVPVLADPAPRAAERALARFGLIPAAPPVFTPCARAPLAGLLLALPALAATGLLETAHAVYGGLPNGFYSLDTMLCESVFRALLGQARAEGAARIDPAALGRVLGLDRAPEVKTIRRKIGLLAEAGKAGDWIAAMARRRVQARPEQAAVLYVDGHVRAYQGTRRIAKTHVPRLKFPAPATVETWVSDAAGDPLLVVMAEPAASLAAELRRLIPELRATVGDDRRVLVGFDRGGWSPTLFADLDAAGFDTLTWRKGAIADIDEHQFADAQPHRRARPHPHLAAGRHRGRTGHRRRAPPGRGVRDAPDQPVQRRRNPADAHPDHPPRPARRRDPLPDGVTLAPGEPLPLRPHAFRSRLPRHLPRRRRRPGPGWCPTRPRNPPTSRSRRPGAHCIRPKPPATANCWPRIDAAAGGTTVVTNEMINTINADVHAAEATLDAALAAHQAIPARLPLAEVNPGQQVLDTETKLIHHAIRIAAFNTAQSLARAIVTGTGYTRADDEAHTLIRTALAGSGDIIPDHDTLHIRLDPLPAPRHTAAIDELCHALNDTNTVYPGTDLTLRYSIKSHR